MSIPVRPNPRPYLNAVVLVGGGDDWATLVTVAVLVGIIGVGLPESGDNSVVLEGKVCAVDEEGDGVAPILERVE